MKSPIIYKEAVDLNMSTLAVDPSRVARMFNPKWYSNLNYAAPLAGAAIGSIGSLKSQQKAIREGRQEKLNYKKLVGTAAAGAGAGLGVAQIRPLRRAWEKGLTPSKFLSSGESLDMIANNPQWAKQYVAGNPKFFSKDYFRRIGSDFAHPIQSFKALGTNMTHGKFYDNQGKALLYKRSPIGMSAMIAAGGIKPVYDMSKTILNKNMSPRQKAINIGASTLSSVSPLNLPSKALGSIPTIDALHTHIKGRKRSQAEYDKLVQQYMEENANKEQDDYGKQNIDEYEIPPTAI